MAAYGQRALASGLHARAAHAARQSHETQAGAIGLLGVRLLFEETFDQFASGGTDRFGPVHHLCG